MTASSRRRPTRGERNVSVWATTVPRRSRATGTPGGRPLSSRTGPAGSSRPDCSHAPGNRPGVRDAPHASGSSRPHTSGSEVDRTGQDDLEERPGGRQNRRQRHRGEIEQGGRGGREGLWCHPGTRAECRTSSEASRRHSRPWTGESRRRPTGRPWLPVRARNCLRSCCQLADSASVSNCRWTSHTRNARPAVRHRFGRLLSQSCEADARRFSRMEPTTVTVRTC